MPENIKTYRESLFQWIWEQFEFTCRGLKTTCGKSIEIIDPGVQNHGAGPDFLQAHLVIDGLTWHGSVEIHKTTSGWNAHHHEEDRNFNNVILHAVYEDNSRKAVLRKDGTAPFTLCLQPYIRKDLHQLLSVRNKSILPCGKQVPFINQKAFEKQVDIAHKEYFNFKVNELLNEYNSHAPPSEAWRQVLTVSLYDALGIPVNRNQMKELARRIIATPVKFSDFDDFLSGVKREAFSAPGTSIQWVENGMRPASMPVTRIPQAAAFHHAILHQPFRSFLHSGTGTWNDILSRIPQSLVPGSTRLSILRNTVFLPAIYLLGDLFQSKKLMQDAYSTWQKPPQQVPAEVQAPFQKAGFSIKSSARKLGLAHQYKRYCLTYQCQRCEVFKSAIRS
ncbi:MAG: DUF2851 family protein [Balneolaceae bacterium]